MPKYGRGLNREIVAGVNLGLIAEPFSTNEIREFVSTQDWSEQPAENYINVTLANAADENNSPTYTKYFVSVGRGLYRLKEEFRSPRWQ